jgi:hypothetical protein
MSSPPCDAVQFEAMAHDPFAPPRAELELDEDYQPVPVRIRLGVMGIIMSAVMTFAFKAGAAFGMVTIPGTRAGTPPDILPAALMLLLLGVLAWKIFVGRDWARWVFTAFVALEMAGLAMMWYWPEQLAISVPRALLVANVIQFALNFTALAFLFVGNADNWFRR